MSHPSPTWARHTHTHTHTHTHRTAPPPQHSTSSHHTPNPAPQAHNQAHPNTQPSRPRGDRSHLFLFKCEGENQTGGKLAGKLPVRFVRSYKKVGPVVFEQKSNWYRQLVDRLGKHWASTVAVFNRLSYLVMFDSQPEGRCIILFAFCFWTRSAKMESQKRTCTIQRFWRTYPGRKEKQTSETIYHRSNLEKICWWGLYVCQTTRKVRLSLWQQLWESHVIRVGWEIKHKEPSFAGFLDLLAELTSVGSVTEEDFNSECTFGHEVW